MFNTFFNYGGRLKFTKKMGFVDLAMTLLLMIVVKSIGWVSLSEEESNVI
jgi:hypothetical protein